MSNKKYIDVADRAYEWSSVTKAPAPYPPFNPLAINVSRILHAERPKECCVYIEDGSGYVEWITQESENPSPKFNKEILRAFKANGLKSGSAINIEYDIRGGDNSVEYQLPVK